MEELRKLCKKPYYSPFQCQMHAIMLYVTRPLLRTNITPNQVTIFWLILQFIGSLFMLPGTYLFNVIGLSLFTLAMLLDYVDGQIARIKKISTYKGIFLEELGIYFGSPIFFLCFSIGVANTFNDIHYIGLGVLSALCILYSKLAVINPLSYPEHKREPLLLLQQSLSTRTKNKRLALLTLVFRRSNPLNFLFFGIILSYFFPYILVIILFVYTVLYVLEFLRRMIKQIITLHRLDVKK